MRIFDIMMLLLKVRVFSWITISEQGATIYTTSGIPIIVAKYRNGRLIPVEAQQTMAAPVIPDFLPPEWVNPDGPPRSE